MKAIKGGALHDLIGALAVAWGFAPSVLALWVFARIPGIWSFALAFVVVGGRQHALTILAHETWHRTLFRTRRVNDLVGAWLLSYPLLMRFEPLRQKHFEHHRTVASLEDPDRYYWGWSAGDKRGFLKHMLLVGLGVQFVRLAALGALGLEPPVPASPAARPLIPRVDRGQRSELLAIGLVQLAMVGLFAATVGWAWYFLLWLLPFVTLGNLLGELRQFLEHREGRMLIYRSWFGERFFFSPYNFHLHGVHHAYAAEPWFCLPEAKARAFAKDPTLEARESYIGELIAFLASKGGDVDAIPGKLDPGRRHARESDLTASAPVA